MSVQAITSKEQFDEVIASGKTIIDFYANWCGPCNMISPVFEKLAKAQAGREDVAFYKVNIDEVPKVSQKAEIKSLPTFQVYKNGEHQEDLIGAHQDKLNDLVAKHTAAE